MFDLKIMNGLVYDGQGGEPVTTNLGVNGGIITEIGACTAPAKHTLDASGSIVTPGFVDVHTHYDGQVSWDEELQPSVNHGVTTVVLGNCGVGFAPCRKQDREQLIKLMEGVEDIPGTALHEGIQWDWESFPEYMDAIEKLPHTIDFAVMVPHDPLRVYVMGERAMFDEMANPDDIAAMQSAVRSALEAGAVGFSTGRSDSHKTADGDWTPASEAGQDELVGIAKAFNGMQHGVLQAVNDFDMVRPQDNFEKEFELMAAYFRAGGRPGSMSLMQRDFAPDDWRKIIAGAEQLNAEGLDIKLQVAPRAIGVFNGLNCTFHPLMGHPSYIGIRDKSLAERVAIMRDPEFKAQLLSEAPVALAGKGSSVPPLVDMMIAQFPQLAEKIFKLDHQGIVDYEQDSDTSIAGMARRDGVSVWEKAYDLMLEDDGQTLLYFPVFNYTEMNYDNVYTMLTHPAALPGLSDGGAHVGTICDASFPTYLLTYWARDRARKNRSCIELSRAIQMLTADGADYLGMTDRGRLTEGMKADINVIDFDHLSLGVPKMVQDLPAGGQRLLQPVSGYKAVFVSGEQVIANDEILPARPGKLVRMAS
ncbi:N-acyl-D-amino-acid deacylase family protein [Arenicella xantha]|uniref:N-acyl-D-aspartate/D-glutamate deacylase n=1 Tax=Arenicella xantha TaxID=644221 RepID=A0A395JMW8_9GAMM|nr:amidohydrolase family protein [Arenicella xantha]RBP52817.1 N-acyl-D-aspartate/D-glutamate deacylase [Arenicella xantha]